MTLHFISFALSLVFLILGFFLVGRASGIKKADKDSLLADGPNAIGALFIYFGFMALIFFAASYTELRDDYIEKYDNKEYVWVSGTKQFVDKDGKTYFYNLDKTLVKKKDILKNNEVKEEPQPADTTGGE